MAEYRNFANSVLRCHAADLLDRRDSLEAFGEAIAKHRNHAVCNGLSGDDVRTDVGLDQAADIFIDLEDFEYRSPAEEARSAAMLAALRPPLLRRSLVAARRSMRRRVELGLVTKSRARCYCPPP